MNNIVPFKNKFDNVKKYDKVSTWLLYISTFLSILNFIIVETASFPKIIHYITIFDCILIILFLIFEIVTDTCHFEAERHRREDLIDNSFISCIAESRTKNYYSNNDLKANLYKMGVNNFESCFFSYNIAKKSTCCSWIKSLLVSLSMFIVAILGYNQLLVSLLQLSIPIILLKQAIRHTIFVSRLKSIFDRYRSIFNNIKRTKNQKQSESEIIRNILEYETTISWANILLSSKVYEKYNNSLSEQWNKIKEDYEIKNTTTKVLLP